MGPMPASVIATPDALFKRTRKYEFSANANELFDNPYPIAVYSIEAINVMQETKKRNKVNKKKHAFISSTLALAVVSHKWVNMCVQVDCCHFRFLLIATTWANAANVYKLTAIQIHICTMGQQWTIDNTNKLNETPTDTVTHGDMWK